MIAECSLEVKLSGVSVEEEGQVRLSLSGLPVSVSKQGVFSVFAVDIPVIDWGVFNAKVVEFLRGFNGIADKLYPEVRLGFFYNLEETVVFPFNLEIETLIAITSLNLSLSVTGYPCDSE